MRHNEGQEIAMQTVRLQFDGLLDSAGPDRGLLSRLHPQRVLLRLPRRLVGSNKEVLPGVTPPITPLSPASPPSTGVAFDRFAPSCLQPLARRGVLGTQARGKRAGESGRARLRGRSLGLFDWLLVGVEAVGALVVGWLVFQYIYTAYFDTAPHRVSPPAVAAHTASATGTGTPTPVHSATPATKATATRFAEVLAPLVGGPAGGLSASGDVRAEATATATPASTPTFLPSPTPTTDPQLLLPVRLRIPVMSLDSPIEEMTLDLGDWQVSALNVGHHAGSANPGEVGNVVLAAHRDINSALFRDLDRLQPGDVIYVGSSLHEYRYIVQESIVVGPLHTEVMDATTDRRVTLITCTPIGLATQRLVVVALLDESYTP